MEFLKVKVYFRVPKSKSFFGQVVEVELKDYEFQSDQQYCKCEKSRSKPEADIVCNYHYDVDNCQAREQQMRGSDRTDSLLVRSRTARSADLHDEDDDYFNSEFIYDEHFKGQVCKATDIW